MEYKIELYKENPIQSIKAYFLISTIKNIKALIWLPKGTLQSKVVLVYFSNNIETFEEGRIGVLLNNYTSIDDYTLMLNLVTKVLMDHNVKDISFQFVVATNKHQAIVDYLQEELKIGENTSRADTQNKGNSRTLHNPKAPKYYTPPPSGAVKGYKSAAFINLPIVMFILSLLTLIISIILLIILEQ